MASSPPVGAFEMTQKMSEDAEAVALKEMALHMDTISDAHETAKQASQEKISSTDAAAALEAAH